MKNAIVFLLDKFPYIQGIRGQTHRKEVTDANRVKCKAIVDSYRPPLEVIYTSSEGNRRPFTIGKQVVARDPFTYHRYADTPPSSPRIVNTAISGDETIKSAGSDSSSVSSDKSASNNIKPTKHCILDFFKCIASADTPVNKDLYTFGHWNTIDLYDLVKSFMPNVVDIFSAAQVSDWLSKDGGFSCSQIARIGTKRQNGRPLWIVKQEHWDEVLKVTFNTKSFLNASMESHGWINVGYARKSRTNEPVQNKINSMQKMTYCLRIKCHCAKVFLSPMCSSGSPLCQRDTKPNLNIMDSVRHKHGDMQDLIMFAKSTNFSVQLVVLDYAGLPTDPLDIRKFVKELKSIKELVVYHGHKFESISR
ncbi:uncharacterized protein BYT42DRAFT_609604 [Radiomyces spectabilis]|uniref:uncharacterized protein n=1 Tax=Radiomyces spectabilis TaxID=64574 RepID=UPI00222100FB|nr:uncharacterized protein BYT42DRAFT_609604 [Radiomyces spectabilis]KAI8393840.1 hypothetical protein BYT42DRAFT_609604 [Radiomyces spectabilis]